MSSRATSRPWPRAVLGAASAAWRVLDRGLAWPLRLLVRIYRGLISPVLPAACRFHPSCSVYADEALATHGFVKGGALTAWRLCRCHPFHPGGYDPVPPTAAHPSEVEPTQGGPASAAPAEPSVHATAPAERRGVHAGPPSLHEEDACAHC